MYSLGRAASLGQDHSIFRLRVHFCDWHLCPAEEGRTGRSELLCSLQSRRLDPDIMALGLGRQDNDHI